MKSAPLGDDSEEDLITRIAWLYYKEKLTQAEIAERIFLSRQKVQRYLEKARDLEIIRFTLKHPRVNLLGIEESLKKKFGLEDAVVIPSSNADADNLRKSFAMGGAYYLERRLNVAGDCTLGVGWGNTTAYLADYFEPQSIEGKVTVVSLIGNLMLNVSMNPFLLGQKIAEKLDAEFYNIWAPAIAQTKERAEAFKSEPWIHDVLDIACRADINIISIGEVSRSASLFQMGYLSGEDLKRLMGKGAVGDILSRFFDADGNIIEDEVHDRVVAIPLETLRDENKVCIGVAAGASKTRAIIAAIHQRYISVLITDESTAREILKF
ncbi:MAG: sugar-binding transcriptional regulator [Spirochaetes bacterium]|nr:sugar-binding transcriptional regulator [Spirochaetota bacterium]